MPTQRNLVITGIILALALAVFVAPWASADPDGLERVAQQHAIAAAEQPAWNNAALPDYQVPGVARQGLSTSLAGAIGTIGVLLAGLLLGRLITRRSAAQR